MNEQLFKDPLMNNIKMQ